MGKAKILGDIVEGGLGLMRGASKAEQATEGLTATERATAGRKAAELIKSQPQVKASEALGQAMEKGFKRTTTTQADRTRVGGGNIGGAPFPAISEADPAYKGKVWGVMDEGTASRLKNLTTPETAWTTMLGSANQLKTNPIVFDKLKRGFIDSMKQGNLSDELAAKINHNLALTFGAGADIRDPKIWKQADTFEKRAALADVMMGQGTPPSKGGVAIGGEKSGKGVIFKPTDILKKETEPNLLHTEHGGDVPTFAAGPRLFTLEKESVNRPDLHPGFPTLIKGKDLGVNMKPTPTEVFLPDWHATFKKNNPDRKGPGYYDLALGLKGEGLPSQELTDEYIRHLLREGFKKGGTVHDFDSPDACERVKRHIAKHSGGGKVEHHWDDPHAVERFHRKMQAHGATGGITLNAPTLRKAGGGLLTKGAKALAGAMKGAEVLPVAEREANLAKFLESSAVKERLYHGTTSNVNKFDLGQASKQTGNPNAQLGHFFTGNPKEASRYATDFGNKQGANVMPVYLNIKNPKRLTYKEMDDLAMAMFDKNAPVNDWKNPGFAERQAERYKYAQDLSRQKRQELIDAGHDGAIVRIGGNDEYIAFYPEQIKSATGNRGTYDITDPDINKAGGGIIKHMSLRKPKRMAEGGNPNEGEPKPIRFHPFANRMHMNGAEVSNAGIGASSDFGDAGRLSGSAMATNIARDKDNRQMHALNLNYANRFGDLDINVGVSKPLYNNLPKDVLNTNLIGSVPLGEGRLNAGVHGTHMDGKHEVTGHSLGYNAPLGGGRLNINVNKPMHAPANVQAQYMKTFAKGGLLKHTTLRGMKDGGNSEATVRPTPRNKALGTASDLLKKGHEFVSKPFGYDNPPAEMLSEFLGVPALSRTLDKLSYGERITNAGKANVPLIPEDTFDAFGAGLSGLRAASKLAKPLAKVASKLPKDIPVGLSIKSVGDIPTGAPSLSKAEREAGLAKFLEPSAVKERLYHGTKGDIKSFDLSKRGSSDLSSIGGGVYLTQNPNVASLYSKLVPGESGANVMPVYAQVKNPYEFDRVTPFKSQAEANEFSRKLQDAGYDSIIKRGPDNEITELVVFEPNKIKSAIGNRGTYDLTDPDITKAKGGVILKHTTLRGRRANQQAR